MKNICGFIFVGVCNFVFMCVCVRFSNKFKK